MLIRILSVAAIPLLLSGCISTVASVVTAPVKAVGKAADWATTSQAEADRNRGRAMREREQRIGKLDRQRTKAAKQCEDGDAAQCARAEVLEHEIEAEMARPI